MKVHVQGLVNSTDAETLAEQVLDLKRSKADIEHQLVSDLPRCSLPAVSVLDPFSCPAVAATQWQGAAGQIAPPCGDTHEKRM
jgi:hypothetical protein